MIDVESLLADAVRHFWVTRTSQKDRQGKETGLKDAGNRGAVTGGKHADGFVRMIAAVVLNAGISEASIHCTAKKLRTLPGFFRPAKEWDVVVTSGTDVIAVVEVKSQVGSFGNNFNNRVEEAVGNATDFWTAYKKGLLQPSAKPWLGYLFMLEEHPDSTRPTAPIHLNPFAIDSSFQELSYAAKYELVCLRLVRECHYDAACFFTSNSQQGLKGGFAEPNPELGIKNFATSLYARAAAFRKIKY